MDTLGNDGFSAGLPIGRHISAAVGITVFAAALSAPAIAGPLYNFTSFNGPGSNAGGTTVNGINNNGDVIGFSSDNAANPTLLTNFIRAANGTFTALNVGGGPLVMANGINDMDAVVGASNGSAFLRAGGILSTLPNVNGTTLSETAFGLNCGGLGGLVVGQYVDSNTGNTPGFLFNGTGFTTLTPAVTATVTNAQGVNNLAEVTGFYSVDGVHQHGFFYNATTQNVTLPADPALRIYS